MPLTHDQVIKLNNSSSENKAASTGSAISTLEKEIGQATIAGVDISTPIYITYAVTADATGGLSIFTANCPYPLIIDDVIVQCTTANAAGTLKLTDGTNDITDAMICAVDKVVVRAGTIDDAYSTLALNGTIKVVSNGAADRGKVTIVCRRVN